MPQDRSPAPSPVLRAAGSLRAALPRSTARCRLREVRDEDAAEVHAYRRLEEVSRYLAHPPLSPDEAVELVAGWVRDPAAVTVVAELDGLVVGDVRLLLRPAAAMPPATTTEVEAWVGYAFHPEAQGRGLARECVAALVDLAMAARSERPGHEPGEVGEVSGVAARRVSARVFAPAVRSSRLLASLGFHLDGVERSAVLDPGGTTWWDDELWSVLPGELLR